MVANSLVKDYENKYAIISTYKDVKLNFVESMAIARDADSVAMCLFF